VWGRQQPPRRPPAWRREPSLGMGLLPRRLLILGLAIVTLVLALSQLFALRNVVVQAPVRVAETQAAAQQQINSSLHQRNLLTFDGPTLAAALLKADPTLKTVDVRRRWPHGVVLTVTLKQAGIGWVSGNQAYLLDRDGGAVSTLPANSSLPVVMDGSNLPVTLGQQVTTGRFVTFVTELAPQLAALGLGPVQYHVQDTTLDLTVTTSKNYRLILDTSRAAGDEMADLKTLLGFLNKQGKTPAEYIDLRIAGKAYYK